VNRKGVVAHRGGAFSTSEDITMTNVLPITTRYQMILDAKQRVWDGIPYDADGVKRSPVFNDEMPGYLSRMLGRTITAAELQAAERWEWEQAAGGKIIPAQARVAEVSVQIDDYQDALQRLSRCLVRLLGHPAIATEIMHDDKYNDARYCLHTIGELEAQTELMLELSHQAPSALHVLRGGLECVPLARDFVMDEAMRTAYRAVIEALDRTQAALGVPPSKRSNFFEVKHGDAPPPAPAAEPDMQRMSDDELRAALTDARIRCQTIETEIDQRATRLARAFASELVGAFKRPVS
jgi:hypothetical protein